MSGDAVVEWAVIGGFAVLGLIFAIFPRQVSHWNATTGPDWVRNYNGGGTAPTSPLTFRIMGVCFVAFSIGLGIYTHRGG